MGKVVSEDKEMFPDDLLVKAFLELERDESYENLLIVRERFLGADPQMLPEDEFRITQRFVEKALAKRFADNYTKTP